VQAVKGKQALEPAITPERKPLRHECLNMRNVWEVSDAKRDGLSKASLANGECDETAGTRIKTPFHPLGDAHCSP
jgi:hypothetical protein